MAANRASPQQTPHLLFPLPCLPVKTRAMATGRLYINSDAVLSNWRALDAMTDCETGAVVKANGYGTGAISAAHNLAGIGVRSFFVADAQEGALLRKPLGPDACIYVFSGHMSGDTDLIRLNDLVPLLNSQDQITRHFRDLPDAPFGIQLDTGMNRLGLEPEAWRAVRETVLRRSPLLLMSHLACADSPDHSMNAQQLQVFKDVTDGIEVPRSLAATGGILLGQEYHFDLTRPGIGLFGGLPFRDARQVVRLDLPVIQVRDVAPGETVGYGNTWTATRASRIATVAGGYADGLVRLMGPKIRLFDGQTPCPVVGRISMDMIGVDVTDLAEPPEALTILGPQQRVDTLADAAQTIGYEILTSLGGRYARSYSS